MLSEKSLTVWIVDFHEVLGELIIMFELTWKAGGESRDSHLSVPSSFSEANFRNCSIIARPTQYRVRLLG